jgi:hypothetical protein
MTEDQAKKKWCPMVRLYGDDWITRLTDGRLKAISDGDVTKVTKCIGSDCMMWRWYGVTGRSPAKLGYCGLAGKP